MRKKWIIALILVLAALSACGKKTIPAQPTTAQTEPEETVSEVRDIAFYSGTWTVSGIQVKGVDFTAEQCDALGVTEFTNVKMVLTSEQEVFLIQDSGVTSGVWKVTDDGVRFGGGDAVYSDGRLKMTADAENDLYLYLVKQSDNQDIPESVPPAEESTAPTNAPGILETTEPTAEAPTEPSGIRPEFKEAMDTYEAFFNEYCDFMAEYKENPTNLSLLGKYAGMITKLDEMEKKFNSWEEGDMSSEELKYYLDVTSRIQKRMVDLF